MSKSEDERRKQDRSRSHFPDLGAGFQALVEQVPALVYVDTNEVHARPLYVSPEAIAMLGHDPEAFPADEDLCNESVHPDDRERVDERWEACVRTGEAFHDEYRFVRSDGNVIWVADDARLARSPDGDPLYWVGVLIDITARKTIELELRSSEARYRALVEQVPAVVYEMGPDDERRTIYVSKYVEELFGYTRREWLDQPDIWIELLHPDDREVVLAAHDLHSTTGEVWRQEYRLIANDGRTIWVHDNAVLVHDVERRWYGIMVDISARKELEEQLGVANRDLEHRVVERTAALADANEMMALEIEERRRIEAELVQTRERYRLLVEDLPAVVYLWHIGDPGGEASLSYTSPQVERLLGFTPDEWNSPNLWSERLHPHDRDRVLAASERVSSTGETYDQEFRFLAKDGRVVWVHSYARLLRRDPDSRPMLYQGVLTDVTRRKEAENLAEDAQERLEAAESLGSVGLYDFDLVREPTRQVRFRYVTPSLARLIGTTVDDIVRDPRNWVRSIHPDDRDRVLAEVEEQFRTGEPTERTYRIIEPGGPIAWVRAETRCAGRDELGRPCRFLGAIVDITKEMETLERVRRSDVNLRTFFETMPGIPWMQVVAHGPGTGRTVFIGPNVERILGYREEELLAEPDHFGRLIHPDDRARIRSLAVEHDRTAEPWSQEYRMIARDGRVVWFRSVAVAARDDREALVWRGVVLDITTSKPPETFDPSGTRVEERPEPERI